MSKDAKNMIVPKYRFPGFKDNWSFDILSNCADVVDPHPSHRAPDAVINGIPFIGIGDISENGVLDIKNVRLVSNEIYKEHSERYSLKKGDFAYGRVASVGKIVDLSNNISKQYTYSPTMAIIQPKSINSVFLRFFCGSAYFTSQVESKTSGSTRESIGMQNLRTLKVCIPISQKEQQKIAACLSSLDDLIFAENQKLDALKTHKKGLMQQLFPAEGKTLPTLRFKEFRNSGEWQEKTLGEVAEIITGNTPSTNELENYNGHKMFVSPSDINNNRYVIQTKTTLSEIGFSKTRHVKANSVLFVCIGSTIGKIAQNKFQCATNQQINSLIPFKEYSSDFLYSLLEYSSSKISVLAGKQAVPIVNKSLFSSVKLFFPIKIAEQQKIASSLSYLDELTTTQSEKIELLRSHKKGLMQQLFPIVIDVNK